MYTYLWYRVQHFQNAFSILWLASIKRALICEFGDITLDYTKQANTTTDVAACAKFLWAFNTSHSVPLSLPLSNLNLISSIWFHSFSFRSNFRMTAQWWCVNWSFCSWRLISFITNVLFKYGSKRIIRCILISI